MNARYRFPIWTKCRYSSDAVGGLGLGWARHEKRLEFAPGGRGTGESPAGGPPAPQPCQSAADYIEEAEGWWSAVGLPTEMVAAWISRFGFPTHRRTEFPASSGYEDNAMEIHPDFSELLKSFEDFQVEYVIVGVYALAFRGAPRYTGNLGLLISTDPGNAEQIRDAVNEFGFGDSNVMVTDFTQEGRFIRLGHPPVRVALLTSISGVMWKEARAHRVEGCTGMFVSSSSAGPRST